MRFNVLISSAGRRISLLRLFRQAVKELDLDGRVMAADCSLTAPAYHDADKAFLVPRCSDPSFVDAVLSICRKHAVRLIIPTIDPELPVYARYREAFATEGTVVAVSSPVAVSIGGDKVLTNGWLREEGFPTVKQWYGPLAASQVSTFPVVVKPRNGSASIGVWIARDAEELGVYLRRTADPVVETVAPGVEYTVNVLVGKDGRAISAVPHLRLEVRSGEVSKGITTKDHRLLGVAKRLGEALPGAYGALNSQCFLDDDGELRIIEINPRFGGGYPLAHQAGVNFPRWLIEDVLGRPSTAKFDDWEDGLAMLRYDDAIFVRREAIE